MVRSVADRAFLPAKSLFEQVGNMMILTGKTITATIRPPYPYGGEFVSQFLFALQLCWFPMLISTVAFGFGARWPKTGRHRWRSNAWTPGRSPPWASAGPHPRWPWTRRRG